MNENIILQKTIQFSLRIITYAEQLEQDRKYIIARQLLKSGTSIGANIHEAQHAESKIDFTHKCKIAAKEAEETNYWLILCKESNNYPDCSVLLEELAIIQKLIGKIISTSKKNLVN